MDQASWLRANGEYLAAALRWLRAKLQFAAQEAGYPTAGLTLSADDVAQAAEERDRAAAIQPAPALHLLADLLRLTPFERDTVLLCAATEFDTRIPALCGRAMGSLEHPYPSFALALSLFDEPAWAALAPHRPLRYWRVLDANPAAGQPLTAAALRIDERIVHYLKGLNLLDPRLALLTSPVDPPPAALPHSQAVQAEAVRSHWTGSGIAGPAPVIMLAGPDRGSKLLVAGEVARQLSRVLYRIEADALPATPAESEALARLFQREAALLPIILFLDAAEGTPADSPAVSRFLERAVRSDGFVFVASREPAARLSVPYQILDISKPTVPEQRAAWESALSLQPIAERVAQARQLAAHFSLNVPDIDAAAHSAQLESAGWPERLWQQCRDRARPRLDTLAQRVDCRATWADLVLADETLQQLHEIAGQARARGVVYYDWQFSRRLNRGLGLNAMFTGESGTGKTMAAEVLAQDLQAPLYKIDLSQVVSKYIGETEKNLQRVFDVMEGSGAILFFDEADSLFGKRSEVRDSHDRYANIEVNYLLQRMESYSGLAILATNMKTALDPAFLRRLRFVVPFHFPSPQERQQLWRKVLPAAVPVEALDYERLARLHLSGAAIHNVALNAAFLAANNGGRVTMHLLMQAARSEMRKLERPASEAEFRL